MISAYENLNDTLVGQSIIPQDDAITIWARKTLEISKEMGICPVGLHIYATLSADHDEPDNFEVRYIELTFPVPPDSQIEYKIRRTSTESDTWIWCGPSHVPASDDSVNMYLTRIQRGT